MKIPRRRGSPGIIDAAAAAASSLLDEILKKRDGVDVLVDALVEMEGVAKLLASLEFVEGSFGGEDGCGCLQA